MREDQDWPSVWPAAQSFRASVVPLPVRMGWRRKPDKRAPYKTIGNLELLKIPNFLHLSPEHIRRHCEAIKRKRRRRPFARICALLLSEFCTEFPPELREDQSLVHRHLPVTMRYSSFVHQGTSIRDIRARVVTISVQVADLNLDAHAKDKLRRLVGNRYDDKADRITIVADRCFSRQQNYDYAEYLLTVLFFEATKLEEWEKLKQRDDEWKPNTVSDLKTMFFLLH